MIQSDLHRLIVDSGLPVRQLTKHFVEVRRLLTGFMRSRYPTSSEFERMYDFFREFSSAYTNKKNIINIDYIMLDFLLRFCGQEMWDEHHEDFAVSQKSHAVYAETLQRMGAFVMCPVRQHI